MADVVVGGDGVAAEEGDAELDEAGAVGFGFVGDGADEGAFAGAHLGNGFRDAVLAGDGEVGFAVGVAGCVEDAEGAGVSSGGDEDALAFGLAAEELGDGGLAGLAACRGLQAG